MSLLKSVYSMFYVILDNVAKLQIKTDTASQSDKVFMIIRNVASRGEALASGDLGDAEYSPGTFVMVFPHCCSLSKEFRSMGVLHAPLSLLLLSLAP